MAFVKGKPVGIKDQLENMGYVKMDKGTMDEKEGVLIAEILRGESAENGTFIYVAGSYKGNQVYVSVPAASIDNFISITPDDIDQIRNEGLKLYVEKKMSKNNRTYFIAYIDD